MRKVRLGKSDLYVNPIGLGANAVGGHNLYPDLDEEAGKQLVRTAIESGINFIDTAYMYGLGRSEELIGEVLKESGKRSDVIIATKVSSRIVGGKKVINNSPQFLREEAEKCLKRLQTDYIDLLYIHHPDADTPKNEAVGALRQLKDEGKIRAIGVSNFSMAQLKDANEHGDVDVIQEEYHLLNRTAEDSYFPYTTAHQISFIPFFPLASGLLTGKYSQDAAFQDLRQNLPYFQKDVFANNLAKVERLRPLAEAKGVDIAHVVLAWYLHRDEIGAIIPGAKNEQQVLSNLKTLNVQLNDDEFSQIDQIFHSNG